MEINIGLCQMNVTDDYSQNLQRAESMLRQAVQEGALIAILPEMFCCPYDIAIFRQFALSHSKEILQFLSEVAAKYELILVAGSIPELSESGKLYNTSYIFDSNGIQLDFHRKMHLFDVDIEELHFSESEAFSAGKNITVVNTDILNIGVGICYDMRFPEQAIASAINGAQMMVYPAAFNTTTGPLHWELTARARAVDAQLYLAAVAPAINRDLSYHSYGHSILVDPMGSIVGECGFDEELLVVPINIGYIYSVRSHLPILSKRKPFYRLK